MPKDPPQYLKWDPDPHQIVLDPPHRSLGPPWLNTSGLKSAGVARYWQMPEKQAAPAPAPAQFVLVI